jgi:membrane AbrB-like protein
VRRLADWLLLIVLSAAFVGALQAAGCPAALFLGPMAAGIALALGGRTPTVPASAFTLGQGFLGALVARSASGAFWATLAVSWPYLLGGTLWAIVLGGALSLGLHRLRVLPGASAFWSLSPGSASIMALMSADYGADLRVVAFAQYYRVLLVSLAAAAVSGLWLPSAGPAEAAAVPGASAFFAPFDGLDLLATTAAVLLGLGLARLLPLPGGQLLLPMALTVALKAVWGATAALPPWVLAPCYALVGWRIGLGFTKESLRQSLRALPVLTVAVILMILGCGLFGSLMVRGAGLTPLTAYLASSPGGLDAVTVIAAGAEEVDLSIVAAMQACRLFLVILLAPLQARLLTRLSRP